MKCLLRYLILVLVASIFSEGCHYGWGRKKRDAATEVEDSSELRQFFVTCLNGMNAVGYDNDFWQTVTDVTVLDTAWYDTTASTQCKENTITDNSTCWISALSYYISSNSALMQPATTCIHAYFSFVGNVNRWSAWSRCTKTCGTGRQTRRRICRGPSCSESTIQTRNCATPPCRRQACRDLLPSCSSLSALCENAHLQFYLSLQCNGTCRNLCRGGSGVWLPWSSWSSCTRTCGEGLQTRRRNCNGALCSGISVQNRPCQPFVSCSGIWRHWGSWSPCSRTCNSGYSHRTRICFGGSCEGRSRLVRVCNTIACRRGNWGRWRSWSTCSKTCNVGFQHRRRRCNPIGTVCYGHGSKTRVCSRRNCPASPFPTPITSVQQCVGSASSVSLSPLREPINYVDLNRFLSADVRCTLWKSLRILQYTNKTYLARANLDRSLASSGFLTSSIQSTNVSSLLRPEAIGPQSLFGLRPFPIKPRPTENGRFVVSQQVIQAALNENIPSYLLDADEDVQLPPTLLNINTNYNRISATTVCLATITKSFSPLRQAVESCASSFSRRRNGKK